ncbi:MAG: peroxidase-related enzyme [Alphaproteobacteria bacterium]
MSEVLKKFTKTVPGWRPRVTPVDLETATDEQLDALKITPSNTKVTDYVLVLAHDPETLQVRSPLFNAIMYNPGGLSRAEREVGALGASIVNHCIFCAAVHATRHSQLEKSNGLVEKIFAAGTSARLDERNQAIFDFSIELSRSPGQASSKNMQRLRDAGLKEEEIVDLILSAALFGWANRLMHILGDPIRKTGS